MLFARRSLLTQSPLEDASPLNAPRFKSPPRAQANKNFGKMRFLPGRRRSGQSEEAVEASLGYEESLESEEGTAGGSEENGRGNRDPRGVECHVAGADREGAAGKKRKLAFPEAQDKQLWKPWQIGKVDAVNAAAHGEGGLRGPAVTVSSAPPERPWLHCAANPTEAGLVGVQGAAIGGHVAAPEGDTREDDFLEGLDLDRLEAEALAARSQQAPPRSSMTSERPNLVARVPEVPGAPCAVGMSNSSLGLSGLGKVGLPQGEMAKGVLARTPVATERSIVQVATSGGRLRKRRSLEDDDGMPSFDLGLD